MRCPFCGHEDTQVKDSRASEDDSAIRRRRLCSACGARFTTCERVQIRDLVVLKKSGARKPFEREKLARSLRVALRKRPVDDDVLDRVVANLVRRMETLGETEISTQAIGTMVLETLRDLDLVAYVRYASVYNDFRTPADFHAFVASLPTDAGE